MKRVLTAVALIAALTAAFFLGRASAPDAQGYTFYATIDSRDGEHLYVTGVEINDINHRGEFQCTVEDDTILRWRGTGIALEDLDPGDTIAITYTGETVEIAPVILQRVLEINLLDDEL